MTVPQTSEATFGVKPVVGCSNLQNTNNKSVK